MQQYQEDAVRAHADGRHVSTHPADKAFWEKTCPACGTLARLQPWMVAGASAWARTLTDEQLAGWAGLPIDGATPGDMLNMIICQKEITRRA